MMRLVHSAFGVVLLGTLAAPAGCTNGDASSTEELGEATEQPIINGQPATGFPEAALVNAPGYICSGAVIAPRVVLTAGHCVGASSFTIKTPHGGGQSATGSQKWTEYVSTGNTVNPNRNDVAVIVLNTPINLAFYPPLADTKLPDGTKAVNVGRVKNGQPSHTGLYFGQEVTLAQSSDFPFSYESEEIIQSGDSGGPTYVGSGANRRIVGVNSGAGGSQLLARVDLAYAKIQQIIAQNGGSGGGGSSSGGSSGSSGSSGGNCTPEAEPNDAMTSANDLAASTCGSLSSGTDVDWYTWTAGAAGVAYDISLASSGDADLQMWKSVSGQWKKVTNDSPTGFAKTSNGAGTYALAVRSAGGSEQTYTVKFTR